MMELSEKDLKATIISVFHEIKVNTLEMMERQFSEKQNHIKELNGNFRTEKLVYEIHIY